MFRFAGKTVISDDIQIQEAVMTANEAEQDYPANKSKTSVEKIKSLIVDLNSQDGLIRVKARKALVAIGSPSVAPLEKALASNKEWVRWEVVKTLAQIGDARATATLVNLLRDKMFDLRWLAAEGLIHIGRAALPLLLQEFIKHPDSSWLQEGVHHVLHDEARGDLREILHPVIAALEGFEPSVEAPLLAETALKKLTKKKQKRTVSYERD
jgi:hypothetical protein